MDIKEIESKLNVTIDIWPEDIPFVGNCSDIDEKTDKKAEKWIRKQLESGNDWAWCSVRVTVEYDDEAGEDNMACCSYKSKKDFIENSGYYPQMVEAALQDLIQNIKDKLESVEQLQKALAKLTQLAA